VPHIKRRRLSNGKSAYLAVCRNPEGRERSRQFTRRADAERWIHAVEASKAEGQYVDPSGGRQTLSEWAQHCWEPMTGHLGRKSKARSDELLRVHVLPRFGLTPLARIDQVAIAEWVNELHRDRGLAPETVRKAVWELSRLLSAAVQNKRLASNPAQGLKLPKIQRQEMRFLAPDEIDTLLDVLDPRFRAWGLLAAYSGLRAGELFGLRRARFDALRSRVEVREELVEISGHLHFEALLKSKSAHRTVPLPRFVTEQVGAVIPINAVGDHLLFHSPEGGPIRTTNFRQRFWYPAVRRSGLPTLRIHDLRHTAVSLWIAAGATPKEVQTWAGHSSITTTYDRYGHLFPGTEERVMNALERGVTPQDDRRTGGSRAG
jgi:integrase